VATALDAWEQETDRFGLIDNGQDEPLTDSVAEFNIEDSMMTLIGTV
jgi:hypothetical protein